MVNTFRDLAAKDPDPMGRLTAEILTEVARANGDEVITRVYHNMVEALIHPHNAEAVTATRGILALTTAANAKDPHGHLHGPGATVYEDVKAVCAHLGITALDFERDMAPTMQADIDEQYQTVKSKVAEAVYTAMSDDEPDGLVN